MHEPGRTIQHKLDIVDKPEQPAAKLRAQNPFVTLNHPRSRLCAYDRLKQFPPCFDCFTRPPAFIDKRYRRHIALMIRVLRLRTIRRIGTGGQFFNVHGYAFRCIDSDPKYSHSTLLRPNALARYKASSAFFNICSLDTSLLG